MHQNTGSPAHAPAAERGVPGPAPRVSVFSPSHDPRYLDDCLASLQAQSYQDWEWIVLLNGGARWRPSRPDERIRVVMADDVKGVGAAKQRACNETRGEFLVELDHDDVLARDALGEVVAAFDAHPDAVLVYSDWAQIRADGSRDESRFDERHGWEYRDEVVDGRRVLATRSLAPTPHNVSYIWYAPNHLRAFRWSAYNKVGGYDEKRDILDDQDLMSRLYQVGDFHHVPRCLYLQRMHTANTQIDPVLNARIQAETIALYNAHIEANALAWAERKGLVALDLGSTSGRSGAYLGVDRYPGPNVDLVGRLPARLPLDDGSVGVIRAVDALGRVAEKIPLINELYRLLAPSGMLLSLTPSTDGRGAFQDPGNVAFYNQNSFWYYTDESFRRSVPELTARFQSSRLVTYFPSDWHRDNEIPYVAANLIAVKDGGLREGGLFSV